MFMLFPRESLHSTLQATSAMKTVEAQQLKETHVKLEEKMKSEAKGLQELLGPKRMKELFGGASAPGTAAAAVESGMKALLGKDRGDGAIPIYGKAGSATTGADGATKPVLEPS